MIVYGVELFGSVCIRMRIATLPLVARNDKQYRTALCMNPAFFLQLSALYGRSNDIIKKRTNDSQHDTIEYRQSVW